MTQHTMTRRSSCFPALALFSWVSCALSAWPLSEAIASPSDQVGAAQATSSSPTAKLQLAAPAAPQLPPEAPPSHTFAVPPTPPLAAPQPITVTPLFPQDDVALLKTHLRLNNPKRNVAVYALAEIGALTFLQHSFQSGKNGSLFDLRNEGNQSTMFFFARLSAELELAKRHSFVFVYQPIDVRTEAVARRDLAFDNVVFPTGTPMDLRYGFDFYRLTYQFDFFRSPRYELALGLGGQVRNAKIIFTSVDGKLRSVSDDLGFVPLLRARGRYTFQNGVFAGFEIDGFYANIRGLNGGKSDVEGAIVDASVRVGLSLTSFADTFLNVRYLGGGGNGTSSVGSDNLQGDGYTYNWLHSLVISLGFAAR